MSGTGKTIIASAASLSLSGSSHYLQRVLQNDGTAAWTGGDVRPTSGTFNNNGSFTANSDGPLNYLGESGVNAFNNAGSFTQQGTGVATFGRYNADVSFNNSGTAVVAAGTLDCDTGGAHSGHFTVASGATLRLQGTHTFDVMADIAGPGGVSVPSGTTTINGSFVTTASLVISGGTVNANAALTLPSITLSSGELKGSGDVTISGTMNWSYGTMSGTGKTIIASAASLSLSGSSHYLQRVLQNDGAATWTGGDVRPNSGTFNNNGSFTANSDGPLNYLGESGVNAFNNVGSFTQQGSGLATFARYNADVSFTNSGMVEARGGVLQFAQTYVQPGGLTLLLGGRLQADQGFTLLGGTLAGTNTLTGSVSNTGGTLSAGISPGKLTITGNYVQGSGGAIKVELAGTTPGTGFDQVAVGGSAQLAGTLNASLYGGFYPAPNATFIYLTAASRSGTFSTFNYPSNVVGLTNELTATTATIRVINTLPVITPVGDRTNDEMVAFNVTALADDYDTPKQTLTWSLVSGPPGLNISSGGAISWTSAEDQGPNTNTVTIRVTDNGIPNLSTTNTFQVVINEINRAPLLLLPLTTTVNELSLLSVSAAATDPDIPTNTWTFGLVSPPLGMTIDPASGAIAWTPTEAQGPGTYTVTVSVTDTNPWTVNEQSLTTTGSFQVVVREVNTAPVLTVPGTQTLDELTLLTVTNMATDADFQANPLTFAIVSGPTGAVMDATSGVLTWTPSEEQGPSTNVFLIKVTDSSPDAVNEQHLSDTKSFTVIVNEVNTAPVLPAQTNLAIAELTTLIVTNAAMDTDIPTNSLTYALLHPPTGASIDAHGVITWTPTQAQGPSTNIITTVVTDYSPDAVNEQRLSATNSFTVTVNPLEPCLLTPVSFDGCQFLLLVSGSVGPDYSIQTSPDLLSWSELIRTNPPTMPMTVVDTNACSFSNRFYRAVLGP
jgi:hypothetical protein